MSSSSSSSNSVEAGEDEPATMSAIVAAAGRLRITTTGDESDDVDDAAGEDDDDATCRRRSEGNEEGYGEEDAAAASIRGGGDDKNDSGGEEEEEEDGGGGVGVGFIAPRGQEKQQHHQHQHRQGPLPPPPQFDAAAMARDALSHPCFYASQEIANHCATLREAELGTMSMGQLRQSYSTSPGEFNEIMGKIGVSYSQHVADLFPRQEPEVPTEVLLQNLDKIIALNWPAEVRCFYDLKPCRLPTLEGLYSSQFQKPKQRRQRRRIPLKRDMPLCVVMGSSGSGKTFFCLEFLTQFQVPTGGHGLPRVAAYLKPADTGVKFSEDPPANRHRTAADALVDWIKEGLGAVVKRKLDREEPLNMHVCLVVDEAGDASMNGYFEDRATLIQLCTALERRLAKSVLLVVAGTNLTGTSLSSHRDAYFFRMKPWKGDDLAVLLQKRASDFKLDDGVETVSHVADAIYSESVLGGLTTNARSAFFLLNAIADISEYQRTSWRTMLSASAPTLVGEVVNEYLGSNRIKSLEKKHRRRVAAWVLYELSQLKGGSTDLPGFVGLTAEGERVAAMSLLHFNVERSGNSLSLVENREQGYSATVTPAIAIVLFTMLGVPAEIMSGWQAMEEIAVLYAVRQLVFGKLHSHLQAIGRLGNEASCRVPAKDSGLENSDETSPTSGVLDYEPTDEELTQALEKVRVVRLHLKLEKGSKAIPLFSSDTIFLNGYTASSADVIAPYMFIQTKHTINAESPLQVDIRRELGKCHLLRPKEGECVGIAESRAVYQLSGLRWMWGGGLNRSPVIREGGHFARASADVCNLQGSKAFPENVLMRYKPIENVPLASITDESELMYQPKLWQNPKALCRLRDFVDKNQIRFILMTNATSVRLTGFQGHVQEAKLDHDLRPDKIKMGAEFWNVWAKFLDKEVREDVKIQFVFTRSA